MRVMSALRLVLIVVIAVVVLGTVPAYSSQEGVMISALAIDPLTPTTLYAGTAGGVFKSMDGGASWSGIGLINVSALAIDPLTPTTVYAGTGTFDMGALGGVFKSTDGGVSWNATGSLTGIVWSLAIDPLTPTTVYAGTLGYDSFDTEPGSLGGVYKSTDGGASWNAVALIDPGPFTYCSPCGGVSALAIDPLTPTTISGVTAAMTVYFDDGSFLYTVPGYVLKSTDGGASWSRGLSNVSALAIDPLTPNTLYAGVYDEAANDSAVYKSTDGGASWNATGLTGVVGVLSLAIDPLTPATLYTGTYGGVYKSTDGGASWNAIGPTGVGGVLVLAIDPTPTTLYAGTGTSGVYKSTNSGVDWRPTGPITWSHVSSVSVNPTSVVGGSPSIGMVTLNAAAPAGGAVVQLATGGSNIATVPASVTVEAGATSAAFTVSTSPVTASATVTISATYGGGSSSAALIVIPAATLSAVSLNPTSVNAGSPSSGAVILSAVAPAGGALVTLASSNTAVAMVPTSVTVAAGATSATFTVSTNSLTACTSSVAAISATYGGVTRSAGLTVTPAMDTVAIQQADYFASKHELRVATTSTGSTATLQVYATSTGDVIGALKHYDGNRYSGRFTWPVNPQNITVRSSLCGAATKAVTAK